MEIIKLPELGEVGLWLKSATEKANEEVAKLQKVKPTLETYNKDLLEFNFGAKAFAALEKERKAKTQLLDEAKQNLMGPEKAVKLECDRLKADLNKIAVELDRIRKENEAEEAAKRQFETEQKNLVLMAENKLDQIFIAIADGFRNEINGFIAGKDFAGARERLNRKVETKAAWLATQLQPAFQFLQITPDDVEGSLIDKFNAKRDDLRKQMLVLVDNAESNQFLYEQELEAQRKQAELDRIHTESMKQALQAETAIAGQKSNVKATGTRVMLKATCTDPIALVRHLVGSGNTYKVNAATGETEPVDWLKAAITAATKDNYGGEIPGIAWVEKVTAN